jgi:hypothetical protein
MGFAMVDSFEDEMQWGVLGGRCLRLQAGFTALRFDNRRRGKSSAWTSRMAARGGSTRSYRDEHDYTI